MSEDFKNEAWKKFLYQDYLKKLDKDKKPLDYEEFVEKYNRDNKLGYNK